MWPISILLDALYPETSDGTGSRQGDRSGDARPPPRLARERKASRILSACAKGWMIGRCNRRGGNPSRGPP